MAYHLEGRLLEVCNCRVLCPCWIGEDPDNGTCDSVLAYHFDAGTIDGVDVAGRTFALVSHIPGNVLAGNFRVAVYLDERASAAQEKALLDVYTGKLGGPVADFAKLVGEVVSVERAAITFDVQGGKGTLKVGEVVQTRFRYLGAVRSGDSFYVFARLDPYEQAELLQKTNAVREAAAGSMVSNPASGAKITNTRARRVSTP